MAITIGRSRDRDDRLKKANTFVLLKVYSNTRNKITTFFLISQPKNVPAQKKDVVEKLAASPLLSLLDGSGDGTDSISFGTISTKN